MLSQIADLADLDAAGPLDEHAHLGVNAPRPPGCKRATPGRWYNFDPRAYLEGAIAGTLGSEPGERALPELSWADLVDLAVCGQIYEWVPFGDGHRGGRPQLSR